MAVNVPDGLGKNSAGFLSYAATRTILVIEYLRIRRHVLSTLFVSAFAPTPFRLLDIGFDYRYFNTNNLFTLRMSVRFAPNIHHLPERFGLFTIIVLGISILGVADGISDHKRTVESITDAALGLGIAFGLWWIYFDMVDGSEINALHSERRVVVYLSWLYIHFPLLIGFTASGAFGRDSIYS
jgi:low temperature requirement protein LtrA